MRRKPLIASLLAPFLVAGCGNTDRTPHGPRSGITLSWVAPSQYDDGSFLGLSELDEFRIYVDDNLSEVVEPHLTEFFLELPAGVWAVSMSSVAEGLESPPTEPVVVEIAARPAHRSSARTP